MCGSSRQKHEKKDFLA